jgi:polar amino acid transport system substrate-binding protein
MNSTMYHLTKNSGVALFVLWAFSLLPMADTAVDISQQTPVDQGPCNELKVGGAATMFPITYVDPHSKKPEGKGYQLARQLGEHLGIPVKLKSNYPWPRMMAMAREGELDIIAGLAFTPEREEFLYFTKPFYQTMLYVFAHRNTEIDIDRPEDLLSYKRVEVRGHSEGEGELDKLLMPTTMFVNERNQVIELILSGRADYYLATQKIESPQTKKKHSEMSEIKQLPLPIKSLKAMIGVSKASPCVVHLEKINQFINKNYPLSPP